MKLKARRERWVKTLMSGKYSQDTSFLKTDDGYCCLGVLCELEGVEWSEETKRGERGYYIQGTSHTDPLDGSTIGGETEGLMPELMEIFQFNNPQGQLWDTIYWVDGEWQREVPDELYSYSSYDSLAEANDDGRSFKEIAELITDFPELVWADAREG